MQTRNFNQCKTDEYIRYPRAGRVDAEPITRRFQMQLLALLFLFGGINMFIGCYSILCNLLLKKRYFFAGSLRP